MDAEIHYGACVTLSLEGCGLLNSRGFSDPAVYTEHQSLELDSSAAVFRILPSCTYAVQREVLAALHMSTVSTEHLSLLEESLEGEMKTNIQTYDGCKGKPLKFGAWVQFEHVASRKYLTLRPQESAETEKDHLRVSLEDFSSEQALFRIEPAFQFQSDQSVQSGDLVMLSSFVPQFSRNAYLHSGITAHERELLTNALQAFTEGRRVSRIAERYEVNASLDGPSLWTLSLFAPYAKEDTDQVMAGDSIWLNNSETDLCLRGQANRALAGTSGDTNGLWFVEQSEETVGGPVEITRAYRLRHISSGLYLCARAKGEDTYDPFTLGRVIARSLSYEEPSLVLAEKSSLALWVFETVPSRKPTDYLLKDEFFRVKNASTDLYLHLLKSEEGFEVTVAPDPSDTSVFKVLKCDQALVLEIRFLISSLPLLRRFPEFLNKQTADEQDSKQLKEAKRLVALVTKTVEDLQLFCENRLPHLVAFTKQFGRTEAFRQRLLREQGCFEAISAILTALTGKFALHQQTSESIQKDLRELTEKLYLLVHFICKDNLDNQKYAQSFLELYQVHAAHLTNCVPAMIAIVSGSEEVLLQAHKTLASTALSHFIDVLRSPGPRCPQLLRFLRALCCFKGTGLSANQEKVHEAVFSGKSAVVQTAM